MKPNQKPGFFRLLWELIYPFLAYQLIAAAVSVAVGMLLTALQFTKILDGVSDAYSLTVAVSDMITAHYSLISGLSAALTVPLLICFYQNDRVKEKAAQVYTAYENVPFPYYLFSFIMGAAACLAVNNLLVFSRLTELLYDGYEATAEILFQGGLIVELIIMGVLIPVVEELIFRGLVYRRVRWYLGVMPAMILSALFFGTVHGNLLQGLYAFIIGLLLAYVYERFHSILAPIAVHAGANILSVIATETEILDFTYNDDTLFLVTTGIALLIFAVMFYLITAFVYPKKKNEAGSAPQDSVSGS